MTSCDLSPPQPERINPDTNQKGYNVKSDIWSLGITMVSQRFLSLLGSAPRSSPCSLMFSRVLCVTDRTRHPALPVRLVGDAVPAAEAGGGGAVAAASCRPVLPRVCGLHLSVVRSSVATEGSFERGSSVWSLSLQLKEGFQRASDVHGTHGESVSCSAAVRHQRALQPAHVLSSPPQQHPFFMSHEAKDTDVASFVKVVLGD